MRKRINSTRDTLNVGGYNEPPPLLLSSSWCYFFLFWWDSGWALTEWLTEKKKQEWSFSSHSGVDNNNIKIDRWRLTITPSLMDPSTADGAMPINRPGRTHWQSPGKWAINILIAARLVIKTKFTTLRTRTLSSAPQQLSISIPSSSSALGITPYCVHRRRWSFPRWEGYWKDESRFQKQSPLVVVLLLQSSPSSSICPPPPTTDTSSTARHCRDFYSPSFNRGPLFNLFNRSLANAASVLLLFLLVVSVQSKKQ